MHVGKHESFGKKFVANVDPAVLVGVEKIVAGNLAK